MTIRAHSSSGAGLAVNLVMRALGIALGAGTIVFVYKIGELIAPQRQTVAFVAGAITGLNPMFIFVTASVNNDALAMLLNGALIWLLLRNDARRLLAARHPCAGCAVCLNELDKTDRLGACCRSCWASPSFTYSARRAIVAVCWFIFTPWRWAGC